MREDFQVYRVESQLVPVTGVNQSHVTQIVNLPKYIAVGENCCYPFDEKPEIKSNVLTVDSDTLVVGRNNCIMGLIRRNVNIIKQYCTAVFIENGLQPTLVRVSANSVLLIGIEICPTGGEKFLNECMHCIISIPCACMVKADGLILTPKFVDCSNISNYATI